MLEFKGKLSLGAGGGASTLVWQMFSVALKGKDLRNNRVIMETSGNRQVGKRGRNTDGKFKGLAAK